MISSDDTRRETDIEKVVDVEGNESAYCWTVEPIPP